MTEPSPERQEQMERALADYYQRLDRGERVDRDQFLAEYPDVADELRRSLSVSDMIDDLVGMPPGSWSGPLGAPLDGGSSLAMLSGSSIGVGQHDRQEPGLSGVASTVDSVDPEQYLQRLAASGLIPAAELKRLVAEMPEATRADTERMGRFLQLHQRLTAWQHQQILARRHKWLVLGPYQLVDHLGSGGMGRVYLAKHQRLGRSAAIKLLPRLLGKDPSYLERFHREARAAAAVDHPHLVRAYDFDQQGDQYYLVMEYIRGQSLRRLVDQQGPLDGATAAEYIRQAAAGLAHAHARGMIHRDVKPSNLMITEDGHVKVLDLGLARLSRPDEHALTMEYSHAMVGTVDYLAPEQAVDSHNVDPRADIYSLGCTLYFLLTGRPPFPRGTVAQRLIKHRYEQPRELEKLRPDLDEHLVVVCARMMAKDPDDRYQTADELIEELDALLAELPADAADIEAAPVVVLDEPSDEEEYDEDETWQEEEQPGELAALLRRNAWALAAGAAVVLLLAAFLWWPRGSESASDSKSTAAGDASAQLILADKPVAWWRLNRLEGTRVPNDAADHDNLVGLLRGNVYLGMLSDAPRENGLALGSAYFDGSGDYVAIADPGPHSPLDFDNGDTLAVEAWINPGAGMPDGGQVYIIGKGRTAAAENQNWALRLRGIGGSQRISFLFRSQAAPQGFHRWNSAIGIQPDTGWHHLAVNYTFGKPDSIVAYINGKPVTGSWDLDGPTTKNPVVDDADVWIGSAKGGASQHSFRGAIRDIVLYRHPLSAERVRLRVAK